MRQGSFVTAVGFFAGILLLCGCVRSRDDEGPGTITIDAPTTVPTSAPNPPPTMGPTVALQLRDHIVLHRSDRWRVRSDGEWTDAERTAYPVGALWGEARLRSSIFTPLDPRENAVRERAFGMVVAADFTVTRVGISERMIVMSKQVATAGKRREVWMNIYRFNGNEIVDDSSRLLRLGDPFLIFVAEKGEMSVEACVVDQEAMTLTWHYTASGRSARAVLHFDKGRPWFDNSESWIEE